jgi:CheY-like chemotaxis protein
MSPLKLLLVDDNPALVAIYKKRLEGTYKFNVTIECNGQAACEKARRQLFDIIVIDAKLDYRGEQLGGLKLADDLRPRYGANAILVISRFITKEELVIRGSNHAFIDKNEALIDRFIRSLGAKVEEMRLKQFAFVAMPFSSVYKSLYKNHIKPGIETCGLKCVRIDELSHTRNINDIVFEYVDKSKLIVFLAEGGNPNAYYEAGFGDAMRKEVIVIVKTFEDLPFDIRNRSAIAYGDCCLREALAEKIKGISLLSPNA